MLSNVCGFSLTIRSMKFLFYKNCCPWKVDILESVVVSLLSLQTNIYLYTKTLTHTQSPNPHTCLEFVAQSALHLVQQHAHIVCWSGRVAWWADLYWHTAQRHAIPLPGLRDSNKLLIAACCRGKRHDSNGDCFFCLKIKTWYARVYCITAQNDFLLELMWWCNNLWFPKLIVSFTPNWNKNVPLLGSSWSSFHLNCSAIEQNARGCHDSCVGSFLSWFMRCFGFFVSFSVLCSLFPRLCSPKHILFPVFSLMAPAFIVPTCFNLVILASNPFKPCSPTHELLDHLDTLVLPSLIIWCSTWNLDLVTFKTGFDLSPVIRCTR